METKKTYKPTKKELEEMKKAKFKKVDNGKIIKK